MKKYKVKEIYYTLQGEGFHTGRAAVFCRFAGCNLWSGREEDREEAVCKFCDTDFWGIDGVNGGSYTCEELVTLIKSLYPESDRINTHFVVCTGGEPALQLDEELIEAMHNADMEVAIETNGTKELPIGIDWICVSPKANADIIITDGNELKLVYPQIENKPEDFENLNFHHFYLQPLDDEQRDAHTKKCIAYCMRYPQWKLSLQTHKILGID